MERLAPLIVPFILWEMYLTVTGRPNRFGPVLRSERRCWAVAVMSLASGWFAYLPIADRSNVRNFDLLYITGGSLLILGLVLTAFALREGAGRRHVRPQDLDVGGCLFRRSKEARIRERAEADEGQPE